MKGKNIRFFNKLEKMIKEVHPDVLIIREDYQTDFDSREASISRNIFNEYIKSMIFTENSYGNPEILGFWSYWDNKGSIKGMHETTYDAQLGVYTKVNEDVLKEVFQTVIDWYRFPVAKECKVNFELYY